MKITDNIIKNGFILLIPIFIWNVVFVSKLPSRFDSQNMDSGIPGFILIAENILRGAVFIFPLLFKLDTATKAGKLGIIIYITGCIVYFASWLVVIYLPNSLWSNSILGYAAPAYTVIFGLIGMSLMSGSYLINIAYSRLPYIALSVIFTGVHTIHSLMAYINSK